MDYLASIEPQNLALSKNPVIINVDPVSPSTHPLRAGLRYLLEVYVPKFFQSSEFELLAILDASEEPPVTYADGITYAGAYYDLAELLHSKLESCPPDFGQATIRVCDTLTGSYYTKALRYDGPMLIDATLLPSGYVFRGGIGPLDYQDFGRTFFTRHTEGRKFLTYKPDSCLIRTDQPEFLAYLTNFSPVPSELRLRVEVTFQDGSHSTFTALSLVGITAMTVYSIPVGMIALGLNAQPKLVQLYRLWVSNQQDERLSEVRSYRVDRTAVRQVRYILFENSLGAFDTLAMTGDGTETLKVVRQYADRFTGYDYLATAREQIINRVTGERELSVAFGYPNQNANQLREWWQEIYFSEQVLLFTDRRAIPLTPLSDTYVPHDDYEPLVGRSMTFRYTNEERSYSKLPALPAAPARLTGWRGDAAACEINAATGLRTGMKRYGVLVKYYPDNNETVKPYTQKANTPGTEGYVAPWVSADCSAASTPFLNLAQSQPSTLTKSNCAAGYVGTRWTIAAAAGSFGSETSLADANARAQAALTALDTQANANAYGSCVLAAPIPIGIRNDCPGDASGLNGGSYNPIIALLKNGMEIIPNTINEPSVRYASETLPAGTYNLDIRASYSSAPLLSFRLRIPSKGLVSPVLNNNQTYRFANVPVAWGDADLILIAEPA
jgi:hypothetical protein